MERYSHETNSNFISAPRFDINSVDIKEACEISKIGDQIRKIINVTDEEILSAIEILFIKPCDLIQEDFAKLSSHPYGKLVEGLKPAEKRVYEKYGSRIDNYYLYLIPHRYLSVREKDLLVYFIPKKYPNIFENDLFKKEIDAKTDFKTFGEFKEFHNISDDDSIKKVLTLLKTSSKPTKKTVSKFDIYSPSGEKNYEIYLNTEFGSLYIPFDAIKNNDFSLIEERMTDYFSWYYGNNENESYLNAIKPLESKEAIFLKELLTKN